MAKRIEIDGKFYRLRRGTMVLIPMEWLNKVPSHHTISDRKSKKGQGKTYKSKKMRKSKKK